MEDITMSDLSATNCGCGCDSGMTRCGDGFFGNNCLWIILLLCCCGGGCGGRGGFGGFGGDSCLWIILLLCCCGGGCGGGCNDRGYDC